MKRFCLVFLAIFSFFFMKNNIFAETTTTTCKYSIINVTRKPVQFNSNGSINLASGDSRLESKTDNNLIVTITIPDDTSHITNRNMVALSIEGDKFGPLAVKDYDIYSTSVNTLKTCPALGMLFSEKNGKFYIENITTSKNPDNTKLVSLLNVFRGANCSDSEKIVCYYAENNSTQSAWDSNSADNKQTAYVQLSPNKITDSSVILSSTKFSVQNTKQYIDYNNFVCADGKYKCKEKFFYIKYSDNRLVPTSYENHPGYDVHTMSLTGYYHVPSRLYFSEINLYDAKTNSGASGINKIPGTPGYCQLNPNAQVCKAAYTADATGPFHFCDQEGVLKSLKIINTIITIAKILVPIILIVWGSIQYGQAAFAENDDLLEKTTHILIKKVIVGLCIFIIPTVVNAIISISRSDKDKKDATSGEFIKCAMCFAGDDSCDSYIKGAVK